MYLHLLATYGMQLLQARLCTVTLRLQVVVLRFYYSLKMMEAYLLETGENYLLILLERNFLRHISKPTRRLLLVWF